MFDPLFLRPIAHRGLHNARLGAVENTARAFEAAIAGGFGIECDLRPAAGGRPVVFHDADLDRLTAETGPVAAHSLARLKRVAYRGGEDRILGFGEMLDLVDGRVPILVEIKSEWEAPQMAFLRRIADAVAEYRGPLAIMSFDPGVVAAMCALAPGIPRGIVSGSYRANGHWWPGQLSPARREALRDLLESGPAAVSFYAYEVDALPTPVTRFVREVLGVPLFAWTVRTASQRRRAAAWADAAIFEGEPPAVPLPPRRGVAAMS